MPKVKWLVADGELPDVICIAKSDSMSPACYVPQEKAGGGNRDKARDKDALAELRKVKGIVADAIEVMEESAKLGKPVDDTIVGLFVADAGEYGVESGSGLGLAKLRDFTKE